MNKTLPAVPSSAPTTLTEWRLQQQTRRTLVRLEYETVIRVATVRAEGIVQGEKMAEVDRLARRAMTEHAMLHHFGAAVAAGDAFIADDNRFFIDLAKVGKGILLSDLIDKYSREGRL